MIDAIRVSPTCIVGIVMVWRKGEYDIHCRKTLKRAIDAARKEIS